MKSNSPCEASQPAFHYLCPRHQASIAVDYISAVTLWRDAMGKGRAAYQSGSMQRARLLFGAAFETVVVRMRQRDAMGRDLTIIELVEAGRLLARVLCDLRDFEEAEQVLSLTHSSLLVGLERARPNGIPLDEYLDLVEEFLARLTAVMTRCGKGDGARVRALLTWRVIENQRAGLVH